MPRVTPESGQASVELVAVVPFVILAALAACQIALAGHTLWLTAGAARAAARADTVGASPERAARSALPDSMERGLSVERIRAASSHCRRFRPPTRRVTCRRTRWPIAAQAGECQRLVLS